MEMPFELPVRWRKATPSPQLIIEKSGKRLCPQVHFIGANYDAAEIQRSLNANHYLSGVRHRGDCLSGSGEDVANQLSRPNVAERFESFDRRRTFESDRGNPGLV